MQLDAPAQNATTEVMAKQEAATPQSVPLLDLQAQYRGLRTEIQQAIDRVLASQHFILGPEVQKLEEELAAFCGVAHGIGVASGTDALILALRAAGVGAGDEVIVPAFTFIATADAVSLLGAVPVFADVEPETLNLDVASAAQKITARTKAIVPVHLYGQPVAMRELRELTAAHELTIVEDAAQALGAMYATEQVCSMGDFACTSFFPSKNLGGCGDGGMIFTHNAQAAEELRMLRSHGSRRKYFNETQGWNSRLDEIQAAILRVKLPHLQQWNHARRRNAAIYSALLEGQAGITLLQTRPGVQSVFHQYTVRVGRRAAVQQRLSEAGIQTAVYYPIPLHLQGMYRNLGYRAGDLPCAEAAAEQALSLPMYPELRGDQCAYVAEQLMLAVAATA